MIDIFIHILTTLNFLLSHLNFLFNSKRSRESLSFPIKNSSSIPFVSGQTILVWDAAIKGVDDLTTPWNSARYAHWRANPEFPNFFNNFEAFYHSGNVTSNSKDDPRHDSNSSSTTHLTDPAWIWKIWDFVRLFEREGQTAKLYPPTSGMKTDKMRDFEGQTAKLYLPTSGMRTDKMRDFERDKRPSSILQPQV